MTSSHADIIYKSSSILFQAAHEYIHMHTLHASSNNVYHSNFEVRVHGESHILVGFGAWSINLKVQVDHILSQ